MDKLNKYYLEKKNINEASLHRLQSELHYTRMQLSKRKSNNLLYGMYKERCKILEDLMSLRKLIGA